LASLSDENRPIQNMQITKAGEYGVLGLIALARRPVGEVVMIDVLCDEEAIPKSFLGKIFQSLTKAGIVRSARGSGGGFSLARPASEITSLEIIEAIEGPIALQRCLETDADCEHIGGCALCGLLAEAQDRIKEVFSATTLSDLSRRHLPNGLVQQARDRARIPLEVLATNPPAPV
jgi:Rrf2 family protein